MGKKVTKSPSADNNIARGKTLERLIRKRTVRTALPTASAVAVIFSVSGWYILEHFKLIEISTIAGLFAFIAMPLAVTFGAVFIAGMSVAERSHINHSELDEAVQRIAMGHYSKPKLPQKVDAEFKGIYSGLRGITQMLDDKDKRIEGIGRRCDIIEREQENEICRRLSAKVNPEMIHTILDGIKTMAQEGRCEEITEIIDNASVVIDASLEDGVRLRPLADELGRIKRFLEVYEAVHKRKIAFRMSIMCNIVNYRIMPNLILPVVQILFDRSANAGIEDYELSVEVNSSFNNLLVIVRDNNGLRSDEEFTYLINDDQTSANADGPITIGALNRRISAGCGEKYSVKLSTTKLGTAVYIYLPPPGTGV